MKPTIKVIDLSAKAASYAINPSERYAKVLLKNNVVLDKNTTIYWGEDLGNAPIDTVIEFYKSSVIELGVFTFAIFGQKISKDIAAYCDKITCIKIGPGTTEWKRIYSMSYEILESGGVGILPIGNDITDSSYEMKRLKINLSDVIDLSTLKVVDNKLVASVPTSKRFVSNDDFVDVTNKTLVNSAISTDSLGTILLSGTVANVTASIRSSSPIIKMELNPSIEVYAKIGSRGSSTILIGLADTTGGARAGAYFKLSLTSLEVFTVLNDGTERIVTSGVTIPLNTYVKFRIEVLATFTKFYINDVLVRTENTYPIPSDEYYDVVAINEATVESLMTVDYVKYEMNRV